MGELIIRHLHIVLTFFLSTAASIAGTVLYFKFSERRNKKPLNQILNFGTDDEIIFVFSHRDHVPESILPRTSTEDFMAMNNFISALIRVGWKNKIKFKDTSRLRESEKQKNLILVCSAKSNTVTKEVQEILRRNNIRFYYNSQGSNKKEWLIKDIVGDFPSQTYNEIQNYIESEGEPHGVASQELNDVAAITKITNPWNAVNKIFIIAGVRGIGTWGAAECIKKGWGEIYEALPAKNKRADFSALVRIKYKNCDIISSKVHSLIPINNEPVCYE